MFFRQNSSGSIFNSAAASSRADIVTKQACGWFGARQAFCAPVFVQIAEWFTRLLGIFQTYGNGGAPAPPIPPVPHEVDSQATNVPSFLTPTFTLAKVEGRQPATISSASLSSMIFTGLPASFESRAPSIPQRSALNLLPNPPPTWFIRTRIFVSGIPSGFANSVLSLETACVEGNTLSLSSPSHSVI